MGIPEPIGMDGEAIAPDKLRKTKAEVTVEVGGRPAKMEYAGTAGYAVAGLVQINVKLPDDAPTGPSIPVTINIGGNLSQSGVTMAIQPE